MNHQCLGVSFEFGKHLAQKYLNNPNHYTPSTVKAVASGSSRLDKKEIHHCLLLYWRLVLATWRFERAFTSECFEVDYPSYATFEPSLAPPKTKIRYLGPFVVEINGFFRFGIPLIDYSRAQENPYIEHHDFCTFHNDHFDDNHLTLDCCGGISTRPVLEDLGPEHQLLYIAE